MLNFSLLLLLCQAVVSQHGFHLRLHIAAQDNVGAPSGHIGGNGNRAFLAGLGNYFRLFIMILGVKNIVRHTPFGEHPAQFFRFFNGNSADQNRLPTPVLRCNLLHHGVKLGLLGTVNQVGKILPDHRFVSGYNHDIHAVNFPELVFLCSGSTGHTRQFLVHAKIILKGYGGQRPAFAGHLHFFFGFDGLVQTFTVAAAKHKPPGKFVHNNNFPVLNNIIPVSFHQDMGFQGLPDIIFNFRALLRFFQVF